MIATELAQRHPEWFSVYVGTGQVVDTRQSERLRYEETLKEAQARTTRNKIQIWRRSALSGDERADLV